MYIYMEMRMWNVILINIPDFFFQYITLAVQGKSGFLQI